MSHELAPTSSNNNPSLAETNENINLVMDQIRRGYTNPSQIQKILKAEGYNWSYNKVQRHYELAQENLMRDIDVKKRIDQRHILIGQADIVIQRETRTIEEIIDLRKSASDKIELAKMLEQDDIYAGLTFLEKQIIALPENKYREIINKSDTTILKAIEKQAELYGFRQDKTLILQNIKAETLEYLDTTNKGLVKKYRNIVSTDDEIIDATFEAVEDEMNE